MIVPQLLHIKVLRCVSAITGRSFVAHAGDHYLPASNVRRGACHASAMVATFMCKVDASQALTRRFQISAMSAQMRSESILKCLTTRFHARYALSLEVCRVEEEDMYCSLCTVYASVHRPERLHACRHRTICDHFAIHQYINVPGC